MDPRSSIEGVWIAAKCLSTSASNFHNQDMGVRGEELTTQGKIEKKLRKVFHFRTSYRGRIKSKYPWYHSTHTHIL